MKQNLDNDMISSVRGFSLPRYEQLPDMGLYLEQTAQFVSGLLAPLNLSPLTGSMISNYVKKDLVVNPVQKKYGREQIAYLIFIAVAKSVLSMDDLLVLIRLQRGTYPIGVAYNYFCSELENILQFVFGLKSDIDKIGVDDTPEKNILRSTVITVAYKVYLDMNCTALLDG